MNKEYRLVVNGISCFVTNEEEIINKAKYLAEINEPNKEIKVDVCENKNPLSGFVYISERKDYLFLLEEYQRIRCKLFSQEPRTGVVHLY